MKQIKFLQGNINISFSFRGKKFCAGCVLSVLCLSACLAVGASVKAAAILSAAFLILAMLNIQCAQSITKWLNILWIAVSPVAALLLTQLMLNVGIGNLDSQRIALGAVCAGVIVVLILLCTMSIRTSVVASLALLMLLACINYVVFSFRGSEFAPYDLLVVGTAAAVASQYTLSLSPPFIFACALAMLYCLAGFCIPALPLRHNRKSTFFCAALEAMLVLSFLFGSSNLQGLHFLQTGSVYNGFLLNFSLQIKNMYVEVPEQYSPETVAQFAEDYAPDPQETLPDSKPDIIAIMSESYADMNVLGQHTNTNVPVTPFFDSLLENTLRGYALASVFGGGTGKSEYEFLTGNSMAWLPAGCFPFQQYIKDDCISLVSQLEQYGYTSMGTHPANGKNYTRSTVYPMLGFDHSSFIDDYPRQKLLREHVSDQEMYEQIIEWYETKEAGKPLFLFGVTMQNHGGYDYSGADFITSVQLEGYSREYPDAEQYLTILNHTDQALEHLISYFEQAENDVVIVLFGDHFPTLDSSFYEELHSGPFTTLEEQMLQYTVPFFVWANFDIEERDVGLTSLNFLSNYVYEAAGLPLPAYNAFLKDIQSVIPAMNAFGYYSKSNEAFIPYEDAEGVEAEALNRYRILQYNNLFDDENRSQVFFPTPASEAP